MLLSTFSLQFLPFDSQRDDWYGLGCTYGQPDCLPNDEHFKQERGESHTGSATMTPPVPFHLTKTSEDCKEIVKKKYGKWFSGHAGF